MLMRDQKHVRCVVQNSDQALICPVTYEHIQERSHLHARHVDKSSHKGIKLLIDTEKYLHGSYSRNFSLLIFRYNLKTHQKIHEKDQGESPKNYKCLVCPQVFVRREKLNEHLVQAHQAIETSIPLDVFSIA